MEATVGGKVDLERVSPRTPLPAPTGWSAAFPAGAVPAVGNVAFLRGARCLAPWAGRGRARSTRDWKAQLLS